MIAICSAFILFSGSSRNISQDIPQTSGINLSSEELRKRREAYFEK
jgi:ataxin-3